MSDTNVKAVLVRLSICIFPNTRQDPQITDEVRAKKSLGIGAGKWVKHIFPEEALESIRKAGGELRRAHYDLTLPWEEGYRLLPAGAHKHYEETFEEYTKVFNKHVAEFKSNYKDWIDKAKKMHNGTFDPDLYPDWIVMQKHFSVGHEFSPMPKASHFITGGIASQAVAEMREDLEHRNEQRVEAAVKDTWTRLLTPVQAIADKLSGKDTIFRDSLINNVKDIVALIPELNLTGDRQLAAMANEIGDKFANLDPEVLRDNAAVRKETSTAAKAIISSFGQIGKRRFA